MTIEANNNEEIPAKESRRSINEIAAIIVQHLSANRELFKIYPQTKRKGEDKITIENLANMAGDHIFDDNPKLFGITKSEGHTFREYFQDRAQKKTMLEIREQLIDMFDEENPKFIEWLK